MTIIEAAASSPATTAANSNPTASARSCSTTIRSFIANDDALCSKRRGCTISVHVVPPKPRVETGYWQYTGHATSRPDQPPHQPQATRRYEVCVILTTQKLREFDPRVIMESKPTCTCTTRHIYRYELVVRRELDGPLSVFNSMEPGTVLLSIVIFPPPIL